MGAIGVRSWCGRAPARVLAALALAVLVVAGSAGAAAAAAPDARPQSERLAAALRANPVYVTDQLPREVPRSTEPAFAALAKRTGVPTYVLVLPDQIGAQDSLLGTVHDRLGRDGLYVLIDSTGIADARAFGVSAPAADAETIALYALPYDAGPLRAFREFTDAIVSGPQRAAQRAKELEHRYGDTGREVPALYIDSTDRENQSFLTGILLAGVPLTVLLIGLWVRARRGKARHLPGLPELTAAVALALAVALVAPRIFDQTVDSAAPPPTHTDLTARVDRVAAGLRHDALYTDPESPQLLDPARQAELGRRITAFTTGPVRIAVVPQLDDDESAGDSSAFVTTLHARLGAKDGRGVYVVADPLTGNIDVYDYGLPLDDEELTFDLPASIAYDRDTDPADDHRLGARLDELMTYLGKVPRSAPAAGPDQPAEALSDHHLKSLWGGDLWPGLLMGVLAAGLLLGATAAGTSAVRAVARRRRRVPDAPPEAPAHPSASYLARSARREVDALAAEFAAAAPEGATRELAWNCLDTAILLVGTPQEGAGRDGAVPAADLAAATVLAEAGRAALAGHAYRHCCAVNPLHGAAWESAGGLPAAPGSGRGARKGRSGSPRRAADRDPRCPSCHAAAARGPDALNSRRLFLPGPRSGGQYYEDAPGPLSAVRGGVDRLIAVTREYANVQ